MPLEFTCQRQAKNEKMEGQLNVDALYVRRHSTSVLDVNVVTTKVYGYEMVVLVGPVLSCTYVSIMVGRYKH